MKIVSFFSGAGGLDLGFEQEGFEPVIAYDKEPSAVSTYNNNRSNRVAQVGDLSTKTAEEIIAEVDKVLDGNQLSGVVGGPPCQYFSNGNHSVRNVNDVRRLLPRKYAEILKSLNERYRIPFFILENVDGLNQPRHKDDFQIICDLFSGAGFHVSSKVLNAYHFGVAQNRRRLFIIGWNTSLFDSEYQFPVGTPSNLNVRDRIGGLPVPVFYQRGMIPSDIPFHQNHWTMQPKSQKFSSLPPKELKRTTRSFRRLSWDAPSDTVAYGHNEIHVHPDGKRRLSIFEAMRLQGFPDTYHLDGTLSEQVILVSDAVPPPLAASLARSIKNFMQQGNDWTKR